MNTKSATGRQQAEQGQTFPLSFWRALNLCAAVYIVANTKLNVNSFICYNDINLSVQFCIIHNLYSNFIIFLCIIFYLH